MCHCHFQSHIDLLICLHWQISFIFSLVWGTTTWGETRSSAQYWTSISCGPWCQSKLASSTPMPQMARFQSSTLLRLWVYAIKVNMIKNIIREGLIEHHWFITSCIIQMLCNKTIVAEHFTYLWYLVWCKLLVIVLYCDMRLQQPLMPIIYVVAVYKIFLWLQRSSQVWLPKNTNTKVAAWCLFTFYFSLHSTYYFYMPWHYKYFVAGLLQVVRQRQPSQTACHSESQVFLQDSWKEDQGCWRCLRSECVIKYTIKV